jgi:MerR family mercuric resistance operon transcriptional regulator
MTTYTIGQLAAAAGIPTSTVRFYERRALLKPDARSGGNYRQYGEGALRRLRFVRAAQATGFSLKDVKELLAVAYSDDPPCDDVLSLANKRLTEVRQKIKELRGVERLLARAIDDCCRSDDDICVQVNRLRGREDPSCLPSAKNPRGRLTLH